MVDDSDLVFALYPDHTWQTVMHSGTAACMRYADKQNKPILLYSYYIDETQKLYLRFPAIRDDLQKERVCQKDMTIDL